MPPARPSGNDGCDSTGARIAGSSIIDNAKLPVKHMPMAPTPLPPHSRCAWAASARNHAVTGLELSAANARNSLLMHARAIVSRNWSGVGNVRRIVPNRCGIQTVKPASRTKRANRATW